MVFADLGMSLDGFVAGANAGPDNALGDGGHRIHGWMYRLEAWRERLDRSGGEADNPDADVVQEKFDRSGAYVMGRRMFDEGEVGWPDPPPFRAPVLVLTHRARDPWVRQGTTFTFVTDGIESAVEQARAAAGDKDVQVAGGADVVQQSLDAGLLEELQIHLAPVLLGAGARLFDRVDPGRVQLEPTRVVDSPTVTHLRYRVTG
jgi:dihydrofolate reductase